MFYRLIYETIKYMRLKTQNPLQGKGAKQAQINLYGVLPKIPDFALMAKSEFKEILDTSVSARPKKAKLDEAALLASVTTSK